MKKIFNYLLRTPKRIKDFGIKTVILKFTVDLLIKLRIPIPEGLRWWTSHCFHTSWKRRQLAEYGAEEYNRRIDRKSVAVLTDFYEVGLDFTGKTFVDVGCGTRGVLPVIEADVRIGLDPAIGKLLDIFEFPEGIFYRSEKAEDIKLLSNSVDVLCCNNTLNHVQNPEAAIQEMHRVLKPGGLFLLEVFIEPENIAHTVEFSDEDLEGLLDGLFTSRLFKFEQLTVEVDFDEEYGGFLPMRWGGVFIKEAV